MQKWGLWVGFEGGLSGAEMGVSPKVMSSNGFLWIRGWGTQELVHTEHKRDRDETGILVTVNDELLEVALLPFSQHEAAGEGHGVTGEASP